MSCFKLAVLLLLLALAAPAQVHQEEITVNIVEVPVWVTSLTGQAVRGLTAADFELYANGERQEIEYFDVVAEEREVAEGAVGANLRRRRLYVLLFDLTTIPPYHMRKAREVALRFVRAAASGETFAVARLDMTGIRFAVPFTTDRIAIERAIRTLSASGAGDAFNLATLRSERESLGPAFGGSQQELPGVGPRVASDAANAGMPKAFLEEADMLDPNSRPRLFERSVDNLAELADSLAPLTGVKHVVLLASGRPVDDRAIEPGLRGQAAYLSRVHERYRVGGVTLNAIDLDGPQVPWGGSANSAPTQAAGLLHDPQRGIRELVGGTGGTVVYNFGSLRAGHSVTYLLGFRPSASHRRPQSSIRVKVKNRPFGSIVRYRRAYSVAPAPAAAAREGLLLADVLQNDIEQNGMTVGVDVEQDGDAVTLVASVPGQEVLGYGTDGATMLDVFLYVFDEQGVVAWWKPVRVRVDLEAGREFLSSNPYRIRQAIRLGSGRYSAKALLRVVGRDATGFHRKDFEVPVR